MSAAWAPLLPLALRGDEAGGYRSLTGRDYAAAHQAISQHTGWSYVQIAFVLLFAALLLKFLVQWGLAVWREMRLPHPPEMPPRPPPSRPALDVEEETKPTGSGGVKDGSRWRSI